MKIKHLLEQRHYVAGDENINSVSQTELEELADAYNAEFGNWDLDTPLFRWTSKIGYQQTSDRRNSFYSLPFWKFLASHHEYGTYPDRGKSIFCTSGYGYGNVGGFKSDSHEHRMIIPHNSVNRFAFTREDFNFMTFPPDGCDFSDVFEQYSESEWEEFYDEGKCLPSALGIELLTPTQCMTKINQHKEMDEHSNEFWFEGKYLAIPISLYKTFVELVHTRR
jgi:hypothetical protein